MAWANGAPGSHIPEATKRTVRRRQGNQCNTIDPTVCVGAIHDYDHTVNLKAAGLTRASANHPDLIQGLCKPCHKVKTQAESLAARRRGKRPPPRHPADA